MPLNTNGRLLWVQPHPVLYLLLSLFGMPIMIITLPLAIMLNMLLVVGLLHQLSNIKETQHYAMLELISIIIEK